MVTTTLVIGDGLPINQNPAAIYLATLSRGTRQTMRQIEF